MFTGYKVAMKMFEEGLFIDKNVYYAVWIRIVGKILNDEYFDFLRIAESVQILTST